MKRMVSFVAAMFLAAGLLVGGGAPSLASSASGVIVTPDGKVVHAAATLPGVRLNKAAGVTKGRPTKPSAIHTLTLPSCDGVGTDACFEYNIGSQGSISKNGVGATSRVGGYTGTLDTTHDYHSLAEIAVQSSDQHQTIEVGWTVDPSVNKTAGVGVLTPRPFVFRWVNGVGGVYNGGTFVPVAGVATVPGVTNLTPGTSPTMGIWHDDTQHVWWVKWNTEWIGYYPDSDWTGATPSVSFTRAQFVQLFGEIASSVSKPCSDMGYGIKPVTGSTTAAAFGSTTFWNADDSNDSASVNLSLSTSTNASSPEAAVMGSGSPPSTTNLRSFFYGGPMWNAAKTGVGSAGSC